MSLLSQLATPDDKKMCIHVDKLPLDVAPFYYMVRCPRAASRLVHTDSGVSPARHGYTCEAHRHALDAQLRLPRPALVEADEQILYLIGQEKRAIEQSRVVSSFGLRLVDGLTMSYDPEPFYQEAEKFLAILREKGKARKAQKEKEREQ